MITVDVDVEDATRWLRSFARDQVPYATSRAINSTAVQVQTEIRISLSEEFTLRRKKWAERNVKIRRTDFARKTNLRAIVRMEAPGDPSRSDILSKFEEGGTKRPKGKHLAVPDQVGRTGKGVIRRSQRPKAFDFKKVSRASENVIYQGKKRTFMIVRPDGTGGIYQRVGLKVGKRKKYYGRRLASDITTRHTRDLNIRTLYRFTRQAHIASRLHFEETAVGVIRARFSDNFEEALALAIKTGRSTVVGKLNGKDVIRATKEARRIARTDVFR